MKKKLRSEFNSRQYMLARDFEVYYYSDLHFSSIGRHSHAYTEVYLFCEGEVDMEMEDRRISLQPGDVLVLPPGTEHRAVIRSGDTPYRRFVFWLGEEFCETLRRESPDYLYLFDTVRRTREYVYPMDLLEFNTLRSKLFRLLEELHTDRFGRDAQIGLCVRDLLLTLSRTVRQRRVAPERKEAVSSFQAIADYIAAHLEEDLSLDALSRELYLSKYYIAHLFQENTGLSLHQYIVKKRLSACVDAMQGGESIGACCTQFGCLNYSSFYRAFLKEYGCSPRLYLEENLPAMKADRAI
ncbi:MAG: helix-turn-helix domain-containing protein [Oscillospiraceae bacterium]|nr:helix-turn-helix domain-containing protein [Oscillospiraceae bacterium]